jgi:hypothetical protein
VANKDFIVKNSLVVGSTVTINGIELDLAGITTGQVLSYDGNKISATNIADALPSEIFSYSEIIGDGISTSFTINHNLNTRDIIVVTRESDGTTNQQATPNTFASSLDVRWNAISLDSIIIEFETPPAGNSIKVLLFSAGDKVYFSETIFEGSTPSGFAEFSHNLGSRDIVIVAKRATYPYDVLDVRAQADTVKNFSLYFSKPTSAVVVTAFLPIEQYSYSTVVGDGETRTFYITHNLNTTDIGLICRDVSGDYDFTKVRWDVIDGNTVSIYYSSPPAINSRKITIFAGVGGKRVITSFDDISVTVPLTSSSFGTTGDMAWDENYIYICIETDTWKRSALTTW